MRGFNRAIIAGHLTRDPEVRYTVNKKAYTRFTVAVNNSWKGASGEVQDSVDYINVVVWGNLAEPSAKYLKKGSPVLVYGRIQTTSFDAKDGSGKRYMTEINARDVIFLGSSQQSSGSGTTSGSSYSSSSRGMTDFSSIIKDIPTDEDFGKPIGEKGFGTGGFDSDFKPDFGDNDDNNPETDIPF